MNNMEIREIISNVELQGQTWRICCFRTLSNINRICDLSIEQSCVYYLELSSQKEKISEIIKCERPDYLFVFSDETEVVDMTSYIYEWGAKHYMLDEQKHIISPKPCSSIICVDKNILFKYSPKFIGYNAEYLKKVNEYWEYLKHIGKKYFNGEMYSINHVLEGEVNITFQFERTNYKHLIYSKEHDFRNEFHTCTTASIALIETIDGYTVLGKMSEDSAFANQYKALGGALSEEDISGCDINIEAMFTREIFEEIGLDISKSSVCQSNTTKWLLIREKMAFVGVCNVIKLRLSKEEVSERFILHQKSDKEKEVDELLFIRSFDELKQIDEKNKADYIDELFSCYFLQKNCMTWEQYKEKYNMSCQNGYGYVNEKELVTNL